MSSEDRIVIFLIKVAIVLVVFGIIPSFIGIAFPIWSDIGLISLSIVFFASILGSFIGWTTETGGTAAVLFYGGSGIMLAGLLMCYGCIIMAKFLPIETPLFTILVLAFAFFCMSIVSLLIFLSLRKKFGSNKVVWSNRLNLGMLSFLHIPIGLICMALIMDCSNLINMFFRNEHRIFLGSIAIVFVVFAYFGINKAACIFEIDRYRRDDAVKAVVSTYKDEHVFVHRTQYCPAVQSLIKAGIFKKMDIGGLNDFANNDFIKLYSNEKDYRLLRADSGGVSRVKVRCKCPKCLNWHDNK